MCTESEGIANAIEKAVIRTCDSCHGATLSMAGDYIAAAAAVDSREVRQMLDIWWRFNLVTGSASGDSNAFAPGYQFENV